LRRDYEKHGWFVAPMYAIEDGGAPMLCREVEKIVLTDLLMFKRGEPLWVEVKYKDRADWYQIGQQWQHGIDLPNWRAYLKAQDNTGFPGRLSIMQLRPGKDAEPQPVHLWQNFSELEKWVQIIETPHTTFRRGVAYFPLDAFKCSPIVFSLPPDLPPLPKPESHPWQRPSKAGTVPQWPIRFCDESPFERARFVQSDLFAKA